MSYSLLFITTAIILSCNKIQNGDILIPAEPDPPGKRLLNGERAGIPVQRCQTTLNTAVSRHNRDGTAAVPSATSRSFSQLHLALAVSATYICTTVHCDWLQHLDATSCKFSQKNEHASCSAVAARLQNLQL